MPRAKAVTEVVLKGSKEFNAAVESMKNSTNKFAQALGQKLVARQQALQKQTERLSKGFFRFRDNVDFLHKSMNRLSNSVFVFFRRLARIRTAFFILVTFLGIRQLVDFFRSLSEFSFKAEKAVNSLAARINNLRRVFGDLISKHILKFGHSVIDFVLEKMDELATSPAFTAFVATLIYVGQIVVHLIGVFGKFFSTAILGFQILANGIQVLWLEALRKISESTADWAYWTSTAVAAIFPPLAAAMVLFKEDAQEAIESLVGKDIDARIIKFKENVAELAPTFNAAAESWAASGKALATSFADIFGSIDRAKKFQEEFAKITKQLRGGDTAYQSGQSWWDNFLDGFKSGLDVFEKETIRDIAKRLGEGLANAFDTAFGDSILAIMQGRLKDIRDVIRQFLEDIQRELARFAARQVTQALISGAIEFLQNIGLPSGPSQATITANNPNSPLYLGPNRTPFIGPPYNGVPSSPTSPLPNDVFGVPPPPRKYPQLQPYPDADPYAPRGGTVNVILAPQVIDGPSFGAWLEKEKSTINGIVASGVSGGSSTLRSSLRTHFGRD